MAGVRILEKNIIFMRRALRLAARGRGSTSPNPMVGAVIVKKDRVLAEDYHRRSGELHAEALAIIKAGKRADGATLYVTLEPCCHLDKKTPPCTKAIIDAKLRRVIIGMEDPNPKVSGKGISELKRHGIEVIEGVLKPEALVLNEAYIKYITTGKPFVILKVAMTLDGKIATPEGQSKWITGERSRLLVHKMRSTVDAILSAVGTVMADNPRFTARLAANAAEGGDNKPVLRPVRIVIDPDLEIPSDFDIFKTPPPTVIVTRRRGPDDVQQAENSGKRLELLDRGVNFLEYGGARVDLQWLMTKLGGMGITSLMIEGGSSLGAYALQDRIVDKVAFFVAPKMIGGRNSLPAVGGDLFRRLEDAWRISDLHSRKIGEDILIEGYVE